jgi:hypothetical protein
MHRLLLAAAALVAASSQSFADPVRVWTATVAKDQVTASDCRNCDEDQSVMLTCKPGAGAVTVNLPALAGEAGKEGDAVSVFLTIDKATTKHAAKLVHWGLIGNLPAFDTPIDAPLFGALAKGKTLVMAYGKETGTVPLKGSGKAVAKLKKGCRKP